MLKDTVWILIVSGANMASSSDYVSNKAILHPAMEDLRTPGISKETILKVYEEWAYTYDSVRIHLRITITHLCILRLSFMATRIAFLRRKFAICSLLMVQT